MKKENIVRNFCLGSLAFILLATLNFNAQTVRRAESATVAGLSPTVVQFRQDLGGVNNGVGGSHLTGFREITWEDVPDSMAQPNRYKFDYYNKTVPRGAIFAPQQDASAPGMMVSTKTGAFHPILFQSMHSDYMAYSGERIFAAPHLPTIDITFRVPGTDIPASVSGFGLVMTDVDYSGWIALYDESGKVIEAYGVHELNKGLSFIGVTMTNGKRIARVHLHLGSIGSDSGSEGGSVDKIAIDNVIYGEPRPIEHHASDFDGDGGSDLAVFRPSEGNWYVLNSGTNTFKVTNFGLNGDIPADGDFDGDSRSDITVFRPSTGTWYCRKSSDDQTQIFQFGLNGDKPVVADYDRDGKSDFAVWRPSDGNYYILRSSDNQVSITHWGASGDIPIGAGN